MRINVTQQLTELDGTPMVTGKQVCQKCGQVVNEKEPMTVRLATVRALTAMFRDEQSLEGEKKVARFHLALRITDEDEPSLTAEEVVLIKKLVGKMFGNVIVGRTWAILDPPGEENG